MSISVTGKKIKAKRLGDVSVVLNKNKHHAAASKYNHIRVQFPDGKEKHLLFTDSQLTRAFDRAKKNPEDLPSKTWIHDVVDDIDIGDRIADLQEVINQKKLPAAAKTYNHIRVDFKDLDIHLLFTDNDIKDALKRAGKNPEDLPKINWIRDILD